MRSSFKAYIAMSFAMFTVGSSIVVGKWVTLVFPVFLASLLRFGLASVLLFLILLFKEGIPRVTGREVLLLLLQSLTGIFLFNICLLIGLKWAPAVEGGIITSTTPLVISVLSVILFKDKIPARAWSGVLLAVIGIAIIRLLEAPGSSAEPEGFSWQGYALLSVAVVSEALFTLIGKRLSSTLSPLAITTYVTILGFVLFLPVGLYQAAIYDFSIPAARDWLSLVYLAVVVTVIGFVLWYYGVSAVPTSTSASFTGLIAVSSLVLSSLLLHEPMGWNHLLGMVIVMGAIILSARPGRQSTLADRSSGL
ncbi:DMT family transporter [Paenibacillus sp. YPG26]|uniref:DMT family transporter n=1 Tax=Paenibacillus sp. YPG26 TaxID=2878915 RepID=UPI00203EC915|nr:DMT family transporter [Paenibacillus sp. YPG26]USB31706.1 DMT family transporter [Paenibacillus sp. YPG26]